VKRQASLLAAAMILLVPALLVAPVTRAQDQPKKEPEKKRPQAPKRTLEDSVSRALVRARKIDDQKLVRATVLKGERDDDTTYVVVCEFGTGDLGIFEGTDDPEADQFFLLEKSNVEALSEIAQRAAKR
jgi:hypothetical protein